MNWKLVCTTSGDIPSPVCLQDIDVPSLWTEWFIYELLALSIAQVVLRPTSDSHVTVSVCHALYLGN